MANTNCSSGGGAGISRQPKVIQPEVLERCQPVYINIKIWTQDGGVFFGRIKRRSKLAKFLAAHRRNRPLDNLATYEYLVDGRHVRPSQTAEDLGLEDGGQIDAMIRQTGGSGCKTADATAI